MKKYINLVITTDIHINNLIVNDSKKNNDVGYHKHQQIQVCFIL